MIYGIECDGITKIYTSGNSLTTIPINDTMHYRIGGQAISILTTLLLILVDNKLMTLETTVNKFIANVPNGNKITMEMLCNMTAGLPDYISDPDFIRISEADPFKQFSINELLGYITKNKTILYEPGTDWNYGHMTNTILLGLSMERSTGNDMKHLLNQYIFHPLKLNNTKYETTQQIQHPVMHSYVVNDQNQINEATYWNASWGGYVTSINSNAHDLLKLARVIFTGKLLSAKSFQKQIGPTTVGIGANQHNRYYAMGMIVGGFNGIKSYWINQEFGGYKGFFGYFPEYNMAVHTEFNVEWTNKKLSAESFFRELIETIKLGDICLEIKKVISIEKFRGLHCRCFSCNILLYSMMVIILVLLIVYIFYKPLISSINSQKI